MSWKSRIILDSDILVGKPVIRGTRISVELILTLLANGSTNDQILEDYPMLKKQDIEAALKYAAEVISKMRKKSGGGLVKRDLQSKWMSSDYSRKKIGL